MTESWTEGMKQNSERDCPDRTPALPNLMTALPSLCLGSGEAGKPLSHHCSFSVRFSNYECNWALGKRMRTLLT